MGTFHIWQEVNLICGEGHKCLGCLYRIHSRSWWIVDCFHLLRDYCFWEDLHITDVFTWCLWTYLCGYTLIVCVYNGRRWPDLLNHIFLLHVDGRLRVHHLSGAGGQNEMVGGHNVMADQCKAMHKKCTKIQVWMIHHPYSLRSKRTTSPSVTIPYTMNAVHPFQLS